MVEKQLKNKMIFVIKEFLSLYVKIYKQELCIENVKFGKGQGDSTTSGMACFFFICSLKGKNSDVKDLITKSLAYVGLYMHVDNYLDDPNICEDDKKYLLSWLLDNNRKGGTKFLDEILRLYNILDIKTEENKKLFMNLVKITADASRIQKKNNLDYSAYLDICEKKGGWTVVVAGRLISKSDILDEELFLLGECIQLLDDIADCSFDIMDGIETVCTYVIKTEFFLDKMADILMFKLKSLSNFLGFHAIIIEYMLRYVIHKSGNFSPDFRAKMGMPRYKIKKECIRLKTEKYLINIK
jgi:hypothetical protein